MSTTQVKGLITDIFPAETRGSFTKRVLWVKEELGQYPQHYEIEFLGDDGKYLNGYKRGERVVVDCEVRGRLWEPGGGKSSRIFVSLKATAMWRPTEKVTSRNPAHDKDVRREEPNPDHEITDDDLPF